MICIYLQPHRHRPVPSTEEASHHGWRIRIQPYREVATHRLKKHLITGGTSVYSNTDRGGYQLLNKDRITGGASIYSHTDRGGCQLLNKDRITGGASVYSHTDRGGYQLLNKDRITGGASVYSHTDRGGYQLLNKDRITGGASVYSHTDRGGYQLLYKHLITVVHQYWAIQAGLLTPLTFARHRLSPMAAFTSGTYFLHNGRR